MNDREEWRERVRDIPVPARYDDDDEVYELSKLDEPDMQDTAGEAGTSS